MFRGALVILVGNAAGALLFASVFFLIAAADRNQRRAAWFGGVILLAMLTPLCYLLAAFHNHQLLLGRIADSCLFCSLLTFPLSFAHYQGVRMPWRTALALFVPGIVLLQTLPSWPPKGLASAFAYQLPFALATLLAAVTFLRGPRRTYTHVLLSATTSLTALQFLGKPLLLAHMREQAATAPYASTAYAIFSQAGTGGMLLACILFLLLTVLHTALVETRRAAETDPLCDVLNRRGFDRGALDAIARAAHQPVSVALFDIDHFKRINDVFGHAMGDKVLTRFAALLRDVMPEQAVIGRMGGEEFAVLLRNAAPPQLERYVEHVRTQLPARMLGDIPRVTVSCGLSQIEGGETLSAGMSRADQALYEAKGSGRDRTRIYDRRPSAFSTTVVEPGQPDLQ